MSRVIIFILLFFCIHVNAQKYIGKNGKIVFFSEAPVENITAVNNKVRAVYDLENQDLVFLVRMTDFIFSNSLMEKHFNENYLESDLYPNAKFQGKVIENKNGNAEVNGKLTIHNKTNQVNVNGNLLLNHNTVTISSTFTVKLEDYNIKIPKILIYNIAEEIKVKVNIDLNIIR